MTLAALGAEGLGLGCGAWARGRRRGDAGLVGVSPWLDDRGQQPDDHDRGPDEHRVDPPPTRTERCRLEVDADRLAVGHGRIRGSSP